MPALHEQGLQEQGTGSRLANEGNLEEHKHVFLDSFNAMTMPPTEQCTPLPITTDSQIITVQLRKHISLQHSSIASNHAQPMARPYNF
jgi:hypothetical protein